MVIRQLLAEAGRAPKAARMARGMTRGAEMPAAIASIRSPETYVGYWRADRFVSPGGQARDAAKTYAPAPLKLNDWSLEGNWTIKRQSGVAKLGAAARSPIASTRATCTWSWPPPKPVRFRMTIDGKPPGADAGVDVKADGTGVVTNERLYQLVRQKGEVRDRTFRIEFLDPGVEAFAFTFG